MWMDQRFIDTLRKLAEKHPEEFEESLSQPFVELNKMAAVTATKYGDLALV